MLNTFPELLSFGLLSPFLIRIVLGLIVIDLGFVSLKTEKKEWLRVISLTKIPNPKYVLKAFSYLQMIAGFFVFIGLYTQIAALVLILLTFIETFIEYKESSLLRRDLGFYLMMFVMSASLLLSGAGAFAFDLPL